MTIRSASPPAPFRFAEVGKRGEVSREGLEGRTVEVRFRDTGEGIPDEARGRIFIPFYTTKEKGTGLGLAICQRIVKAHNGSIGVESLAGFGTEFIVRLPMDTTIPRNQTPNPRRAVSR